ncbi:MAG: Stk1 family PASTA domain-containing Ser/Thr kinase [Erysipelotrichaceae bacterium]|nr:Stk1 family PASTA domain-containing Ser/Thr kinase [Erysipelotrichaceae bacterium]
MSRKNVIANRYEVVQHIGQGGMADVFRGVDTILNREVAIKILRADLSTDAVSILRFEREAQAATALNHPNIVEIYDVGDYKGHHYIVMEFVPGRTLKQVIRARGPLLKEEAVDIMKQLTSAVAEAHSKGIIHRDIKPQNVIVKADGSVKILDFGIATAKGSMQLTQANNVMGSVHYLAPELAKGETASAQSDIYALGIVLYEMLAGDVPFKADQAVQVALRHMRDPMPSLREANPTVPQSIENIVIRATAKDPKKRYKNCSEMWRDLSTCLRPERAKEAKLIIESPPAPKKDTSSQNKAKPVRTETPAPKKEVRPEVHTKKKVQEEKPKNKLVPWLIGIIAFVAVCGIVAALIFSGVIPIGPRTVQIPDIEGMTIQQARDMCDESELVLDTINVEYTLTENVERGLIIGVTPSVGDEVEKNTEVKIIVSNGIGVRIEDFAASGMSISKAEEYIAENYKLMRVTAVEEDSGLPPGTIIRQEGLEPGTLFSTDLASNITLVYSRYPTVVIPDDIIGRPINDATAELEAMGIAVRTSNMDISGMTQEEIDQLQFGVVISSDPAVGTPYTQKDDNYVILYYY